MDIYSFTSYKQFLTRFLKERNLKATRVAESAGIQKTFLSMVIHRDYDLSEQQAFDLGKALGLDHDEREYFMLLVQRARAPKKNLAAYYDRKISEFQRNKGALSGKLSDETRIVSVTAEPRFYEYYMDPDLQALHMYLQIPEYQSNLPKLAQALSISMERMHKGIDVLQKLNLVETAPHGGYVASIKNIHIEAGSILSEFNHTQSRLLALRKNLQKEHDDYRFSALLTADVATKKFIVKEIKELIARVQGRLKESQSKEIYVFNIDLFNR